MTRQRQVYGCVGEFIFYFAPECILAMQIYKSATYVDSRPIYPDCWIDMLVSSLTCKRPCSYPRRKRETRRWTDGRNNSTKTNMPWNWLKTRWRVRENRSFPENEAIISHFNRKFFLFFIIIILDFFRPFFKTNECQDSAVDSNFRLLVSDDCLRHKWPKEKGEKKNQFRYRCAQATRIKGGERRWQV